MSNKRYDEREYWGRLEGQEFLDAAHQKIEDYYGHLESTGLFALWKRSYIAYYGGDLNQETSVFDSAKLGRAGSAGQVTKVKINNYRSLVKHAISLSTSNKPALTCVAANTDQKSQAQTILGDSLLDYYLDVKKVGAKLRQAVEYGTLFGEGWLHLPWVPEAGEIYDLDESKDPIYEGDLEVSYHSPLDVIRDVSIQAPIFKWNVLRELVNRHELIAKYPEHEEEIRGMSPADQSYQTSDPFNFSVLTNETTSSDDNDQVAVFTFYHGKSVVMPEGRIVIFASDTIFFDNDLPYTDIPLLNVMPDLLHQTPFGYSPYNDLIGPQQAHDNLMSTVMSNNLAFGLQYIWTDKATDMSVSSIEGGLKLIKSTTKPEALNLTQSAPELFKVIQMLDKYQETISGISSTIRGNPESNLHSGTALALVVAQSVQFGSQLEASYSALLVDTGEMIISHLKAFAKTPRLAFIVGIAKQPYMKEFSSEDVSDIKRVTIQQANAMSKTISGRIELAEKVMQIPQDKAADYMSIINTGQLPPSMQSHDPVMNIKAENEKLAKGEPVFVLASEHHANHIKEHLMLVENPVSKEDPQLVQAVMEHVAEHLTQWRQADPGLLMITGQEPPPQMPQPDMGMPQQPMPSPDMEPVAVQGPEEAPSMPGLPGLPPGTDEGSEAAYDEYKDELS